MFWWHSQPCCDLTCHKLGQVHWRQTFSGKIGETEKAGGWGLGLNRPNIVKPFVRQQTKSFFMNRCFHINDMPERCSILRTEKVIKERKVKVVELELAGKSWTAFKQSFGAKREEITGALAFSPTFDFETRSLLFNWELQKMTDRVAKCWNAMGDGADG